MSLFQKLRCTCSFLLCSGGDLFKSCERRDHHQGQGLDRAAMERVVKEQHSTLDTEHVLGGYLTDVTLFISHEYTIQSRTKAHGSALSPHHSSTRSRGNSTSSSAAASDSAPSSSGGLSSPPSSSSFPHFTSSPPAAPMSRNNRHLSSATSTSVGTSKMKARSAVAPRRRIGEDDDDDTSTSNTERDNNEEELDLDSEDEAILGPSRKKRLAQTKAKKKKESLFDILNSEPPWQESDVMDQDAYAFGGQSDPKSKSPNSVVNGKLSNGLNRTSSSSSSSPATTNSNTSSGGGIFRSNKASSSKTASPTSARGAAVSSSPAAYLPPPSTSASAAKQFSPIANLDFLGHIDDAQAQAQAQAPTLRNAQSIADTRSFVTSTSYDHQSEVLSSKASFALTAGKEFPDPPISTNKGHGNGKNSTTYAQSFSSSTMTNTTAKLSPTAPSFGNRSSASSPTSTIAPTANMNNNNINVLANGNGSSRLATHRSSPNLSSEATPAFLREDSASYSAYGTGIINKNKPVRRLQAKDEKNIRKENNDDLIAFLRDATPPPPPLSASASSTVNSFGLPSPGVTPSYHSLPGKKSSKFRSFMRNAGISKRPSTAASIDDDAAAGGARPFTPTSSSIFEHERNVHQRNPQQHEKIDEHGRLGGFNQSGSFGRTQHSSMSNLHLNRKLSKSREALRPATSSATLSGAISSGNTHNQGNLPVSSTNAAPAPSSTPPAVSSGYTSHMHQYSLSNGSNMGVTTVISSAGKAASPAARQAHLDWELAAMMEKELDASSSNVGIGHALPLQNTARSNDKNLVPHAQQYTATNYETMEERREVTAHPGLAGISRPTNDMTVLTREKTSLDNTVYGTSSSHVSHTGTHRSAPPAAIIAPTASANVNSALVSQAHAISGVDTPPLTPEEKFHAHGVQYRPLHTLAEVSPDLERSRTSTSSTISTAGGSPSAVGPGMAHKHQRRLSAVKRKPSPRVDEESSDNNNHASDVLKRSPFTSRSGLVKTSASPILQSRDDEGPLPSPYTAGPASLTLAAAFATPAARLVDEYREATAATASSYLVSPPSSRRQEKTISLHSTSIRDDSSTRSLSSNAASTPLTGVASSQYHSQQSLLSRTLSLPSAKTSRPISTALVPLSPRPAGKAYTDIHDILLSLRNNMISANSVLDCLEMIDATLFEVAYDTKASSSPVTIEEEDENDPEARNGEVHDAVEPQQLTAAKVISASIQPVQIHHTSRYINRTFDAVIEYFLLHPQSRHLFPKNFHRFDATRTFPIPSLVAPRTPSLKIIKLPSSQANDIQRTPSIVYSASESTSTGSEDGMASASQTSRKSSISRDDKGQDERCIDSFLLESQEEDEQEIISKTLEVL